MRAALQRTFDYFTISPYCPPEPWPDRARAALTDDAWVKTGQISRDAWREWEQLAIIAHGGPFMDDSLLYAEMPGSTFEERFWEWRRRNRVPLVQPPTITGGP